jgi:hypothetical protein
MPSPDPLREPKIGERSPSDLATGAAHAPIPVLPSATPALPHQRRFLLFEMWDDTREIVKAITTDVVLFLLAIGALFICYLVLHQMEVAGYPHENIARLEELHFWAYLAVAGLFAMDLLVKLFVFLFLRKRGEQ